MRSALFIFALAACGSDGGSPLPDALPSTDAPDVDDFTRCEGTCRATALTAKFGPDTRVLDRAHYGITTSGVTQTLHVEVYKGGDPGCPTASSATPEYTVVLGQVVPPTSSAPTTSPGNLLDFTGDLLDGPLGAAATEVSITPVAADPSASEPFVALDVTLTFAAGTITGHLFATHCASLDASE